MGHLHHIPQIGHLAHVIGGRARAAASFAARMAALAPVAWWRLGEASGTTAADASGNARTGTYTAATLGASGAVRGDADTCAKFNGTTSKVLSDAYVFNSSQATVACWFRPASIGTAQAIIGCDQGNGTFEKAIELLASGKVQAYTFDGVQNMVSSGTTLQAGVWYHLALTVTASTLTIYVNGVADGSMASAGSFTGYTTPNLAVGLGSLLAGAAPSGWIDEAAWFASALTAAQVLGLYTASAKTMVSVSSVVTQDPFAGAVWTFDASRTVVNTAKSQFEIALGGGAYAGPTIQSSFVGPTLTLTYGSTPTVGDAWRILSDDATLSFGSDRYLRVPSSGLVT